MKFLKNLILLFILTASLKSVKAQDWEGVNYKYNEIYPGYIVSLKGDTTQGYIVHGGRTANQKTCIFYKDASKKEKQKLSPSDIKVYSVGDKVYNSIPFSGGLFGKPLSFVLVVKPGRIYEYAYYTKKDMVSDFMLPKETYADYDKRVHSDEIVWQKLEEKPMQHTDFVLGFAKRMGKLVGDYPEMAQKVENKQKGYTLFNVFDVISEYNTWWAKQPK